MTVTSPPVALLDACILYSATLRDLMMWLAQGQLYSPRWTEQIHDEWTRSVLASHPQYTKARLSRTRQLMNESAPDAMVTGYESLTPTLILSDSGDRHVLAAAIHTRADLLITLNLRHFPQEILAAHGILPLHPDWFVLDLLETSPQETLQMMREQRASLQKPPKTSAEYLERLAACGLPRTVAHLREKSAVL